MKRNTEDGDLSNTDTPILSEEHNDNIMIEGNITEAEALAALRSMKT